jgi:hypothetical protein
MLPGLRLTAAAAQLILRQETPQSLAAQLNRAGAQAEWQQVLTAVLTAAFEEADSTNAGVLQPGDQLQQLLYGAAERLAAVIVGAAGAPAVNVTAAAYAEGTLTSQDADSAWPSRADDDDGGQQPQVVQNGSRLSQHGLPQGWIQQQQQQHIQQQQEPRNGQGSTQQQQQGSSAAQADVVILDDAGGCVHFTTTVEEAAAAAAAGRPPRRSSDTLHVYQARQQGGVPEPATGGQRDPPDTGKQCLLLPLGCA